MLAFFLRKLPFLFGFLGGVILATKGQWAESLALAMLTSIADDIDDMKRDQLSRGSQR